MYCKNCKKEFPGKFCPECGGKLIEKPAQDDFGLNLSDNAAIVGGLNLTRNESHNTTSYDQRVITNNIVERQKTEVELRNERNILFMECCKQVFHDGLLNEEEKRILVTERIRLGIDETEAARLIEMARKSSGSRMTTLSMRDSMTLKTIDRYIDSNNAIVLNGQIPRLAALARNYKVDEVLYKHYMLLAAIRPDDIIHEYETNTADEYWQTYWVAIAYMKKNDILNAEEAIVKLDLYPEYSEDNSLLLSAVSTFNEFGAETASEYISAILPEHCASLLMPFIHALLLEVDPERAKELGADREKCQFYIDHIITLNPAQRKAAEEAQRKAAEEAQRKAAEEAQRKAAEEAQRKAAEEAQRKAAEETISVCSNCGETLVQGARFCLNCGTKIEEKKPASVTCPSCGEELNANAKFCLSCGTPIGQKKTTANNSNCNLEELCKTIEGRDYIETLSLNRSWVLPQFIDIIFSKGRKNSISYEEMQKAFRNHLENISYNKAWDVLCRNLKALSKMSDKQSAAYKIRSGWWSKEVAVAMANDYLLDIQDYISESSILYNNCAAGNYLIIPGLTGIDRSRREHYYFVNKPKGKPANGWRYNISEERYLDNLYSKLQSAIDKIENATDDKALYEAVMQFNFIRLKPKDGLCTPLQFDNAYKGDGVYNAMMTMVKYLNMRFDDDKGNEMDRDECIIDIAKNVFDSKFDADTMLKYCQKKAFNGNFDWSDY